MHTILVVGDNELLANRFLAALLDTEFSARSTTLDEVARDGVQGADPNLLLLDASERVDTARTIACAFRRTHQNVPVVAICANTPADIATGSLAMSTDIGADLAVQTNCSAETLINVVGEVLGAYREIPDGAFST